MQESGGILQVSLHPKTVIAEDYFGPKIEPGHYVCMKVTDTGCGNPIVNLDKIFDPYFTTKETDKGIHETLHGSTSLSHLNMNVYGVVLLHWQMYLTR